MPGRPTADEIIQILNLKPHTTCGFVNESYVSGLRLPPGVLGGGYNGERSLGDVLWFMVTPQAQIKLHRIRSDQMYHHYLGDPLEVLMLYADGRGEVRVVGDDLRSGQRPQLFIPGGTFHTSRLPAGAEYALLGTSVWLRAEPPDVEYGDPDKLIAAYPSAAELIREFAEARP